MYTRKFRGIAVAFLMVLSLFLMGGGNRLWAFSIDVKNIFYADPFGPRQVNNYNFASGNFLPDNKTIIIPDNYVAKAEAETQANLFYTFGPYPVDVGETNDVGVVLDTTLQKATLTTSTDGGFIIGTAPSLSTAASGNEWHFAVQLGNFTGMTEPLQVYKAQIGFGSPNAGPHPEFSARWVPAAGGRSLLLRAEIYDDSGNGTSLWSIESMPIPGLDPASTLIELRLIMAPETNFTIGFDYRLYSGGNWSGWTTAGVYNPAGGTATYPSFPAAFPFVALGAETAGGSGGANFSLRVKNFSYSDDSNRFIQYDFSTGMTCDGTNCPVNNILLPASAVSSRGDGETGTSYLWGQAPGLTSSMSLSPAYNTIDGSALLATTHEGVAVLYADGTIPAATGAASWFHTIDIGNFNFDWNAQNIYRVDIGLGRDENLGPYNEAGVEVTWVNGEYNGTTYDHALIVQAVVRNKAVGPIWSSPPLVRTDLDPATTSLALDLSVSGGNNFFAAASINYGEMQNLGAYTLQAGEGQFLRFPDLYPYISLQAGSDQGGMDPFQVFSSHEQNGYYAHVFVEDPGNVYSAVTAESAGLQLPTTALVKNGSQWWLPHGINNLFLGTALPATFPSFRIVATKADQTQDISDRAITGYVQDFVTITSPGASVTVPPTFSWTWPVGAAPVDWYGVGMRDETDNIQVMDAYGLPPTQTSIAYNGQTLIAGHQYRYWISAGIGPNSSRVEGIFTYGSGGGENVTTFTSEAAFTAATLPTRWVNFEDRDTSAGKISFAGTEYAGLGITFSTPNSEPLWIYPTSTSSYWNSKHLSPGLAPYETGSSTLDSLTLQFTTPVTAIGWTFIDFGSTGGESIRVYAQDNTLIYENTNLSDIAGAGVGQGNNPFWGISSPGRPIARVEIVESGNDSDDVAYDNFRFSPVGQTVGTVSIGGLILDKNSAAIEGATVELVGAAPAVSTTTAAGGVYSITVPAGIPFYLKISKPGDVNNYVPTYTADMVAVTGNPNFGDFTLHTAGQYNGWGVPSGTGIIRARVREGGRSGPYVGGVMITAFSRIHSSASYYTVCYDDACTPGMAGTDPATGRYIVKNVEPGDTVTVTAQLVGWTFPQRVFHAYADSVHQGGIGGTQIPTVINLLQNGSFNGNMNGWTVQPSLGDWNPLLPDGAISLHPLSSGYMGTIVNQNLNITGIGGNTVNLSMSLGSSYGMSFGKTIAVYLSYVDSANVVHRVKILNPENTTIGLSATVNASFTFPSDARKLVKFEIAKEYYGEYYADNIVLSATDSVTIGSLPTITDISSQSGNYGSTLTITGQNFGTTQGKVTIRGTNQIINSWSDTSINITLVEPTRSGHISVTTDFVQSNSTVPNTFEITSPYYAVDILKNTAKVIRGQKAEFVLNVQFFNNYSTTQGINFTTDNQQQLQALFLPLPARNPGGLLMKIDTANLAAGTYMANILFGENGTTYTRNIPFTLKVVTTTDIRFYDWSYDPITQTYPKTYLTDAIAVTQQGQIPIYSTNVEVNVSDGSVLTGIPLTFASQSPLVSVFPGGFGMVFYAEGDSGTATMQVLAPDGFEKLLTFNVNIPQSPLITSIGLSPAAVTNHYADTIGFSATGTHASLSYGPIQSMGGSTIIEDTRTRYDQGRSVSGTFKLDLTSPPDLGTYLFWASTYDTTNNTPAAKAVPLTITNDPSYAMIKGGVRLLDSSLDYWMLEDFTLEFYNELGVKQFSREYSSQGAGHGSGDQNFAIGALLPGTYRIKYVPFASSSTSGSLKSQWWPNAEDINGALPVSFAAGQVVDNIYFFANTIPTISFSGKVRDSSITSPDSGTPIADANVSVLGDPSISAITDASGNFTLNGIPAGQPFTLKVEKSPDYITVYTGNIVSPTSITSFWPFALLTQSEVSQWQVGGQYLWQAGQGMITSRVVDSANPSQTIAGAQISVASSFGNTYGVTYFDGAAFGGSTTAANGLFYIYGVVPGDTVTVTAFKTGWMFSTNTYMVNADSISEQLIFGISGGTQSISFFGAVTDRNNNPLAAAQVEVVGSDPLISTGSDGMGNFVLSGIPLNQTFHLKISMPGYLPTYTRNHLATGNILAGNRPYTLRTAEQVYTGWGVTPGKAVIQGQVYDQQDAQGIGGVTVTAQGANKAYTVTYIDDAGNRRTDRTYGNGKYFVLDVDTDDTVTVTARKASWKFPVRVFVAHADGVSQSGIPGTRTLAGQWGHSNIGREPDQGAFYRWTETGRITFTENSTGNGGTASITFNRNENGNILTDTENFTYSSFTKNADGRYTLTMPKEGTATPEFLVMAISEDGSMIVLDGAMKVGDRRLDLLIKIDPVKTYGNIDLSGDYFGIGYEHNTTAVNPPAGNGAFMAISSIQTFNGAGSYTYIGRANSDGTFWTDDERTTTRSYGVNANGSVNIQNGAFLGNLSGNVLLGGGSYLAGASGSWANYIFLKKGDRIYSTADLAGSWAFAGYGDSNSSVRAESGTMACDAAGICMINGKRLLDNGTMTTFANPTTFAVGADGSFASPGSPVPLGAIGNGGKTLIWNLSFDPNSPQERLIVVAVKVGGMAAGAITNRVWSGTHYDGQTYYGDFVVEDPMHALTAVTLAGPGISGTLNLTYRQDAGAWWTVPQLPLGSLPPADAYYSITLQDGSSNPPTVQQRLNGGVAAVATNLAPTGEQTGKITFTFTGIAGADSYMISLFDGAGNMIWQSNRVLATTIPYEGPPLPMGVYNYLVHSWIGNNCSIARASFTYSAPVHYQAGDVNHDGKLDLADAIIALRVVAGLGTPAVFPDADVNFDGGIGMAEALFVMQAVAGLRTSEQQAAQDGITASLEAYKTLINTKGAAITPADLLPFFHPAYLDNGFDRNQAVQHDLPDGVLQIDVFMVNRILFFDDVRKIATVEVTFSGTLDGNPEMEEFIETLAYDQASGRWLRFGNQKIGEFSAWLGTRKTMSSAGTTDNLLLHLHLWAPQNKVNQVIVSGPGFTGTAFYKDPYPRVEDGITYDQFTSTLGTELTISRAPAMGDTYTFNVTKYDSTMITYVQTLQEVIMGAPEVTAPTGHALADANLGSQLEVSWTLPDARITMENVMLQGQVCNANGCSSVDGVLTTATFGTITLPALTDAISAYIDVRIHFQDQVFTNCRFEFGAAQQTLVTGSNITLVAYGHPPAGFDFVSGQLHTTGDGGHFLITGGDGTRAYGFLAPGVKLADLGVVSGGLGAVTQAPESSAFSEPPSQYFEQGKCYVFQLVNGNYAVIEVKSVNVVYEPSWALTMVFDYKYQTNGSGNF